MSILVFGFTVAEIQALKAAGMTLAEIREAGEASLAAATPVVEAKAPKAAFKVACAYGKAACGTFLPKGVGAQQHTTCRGGRSALKAARA